VRQEADVFQLGKPTWPKVSHQARTELRVWGGNKPCGAGGKVMVGHNASEGMEPRNYHRRTGPRVSFPGSQNRDMRSRRGCRGVPGSESMAGHRTVHIGTWESHAVPHGSSRQAEEARRGYGGMAVGPTHSRGVAGVMPGASPPPGGFTRRGWR